MLVLAKKMLHGESYMDRSVTMVINPVLRNSLLRAFSSYFVCQRLQRADAIVLIDCLTLRNEFQVNGPFVVEETARHAFHTARWIWGLGLGSVPRDRAGVRTAQSPALASFNLGEFGHFRWNYCCFVSGSMS